MQIAEIAKEIYKLESALGYGKVSVDTVKKLIKLWKKYNKTEGDPFGSEVAHQKIQKLEEWINNKRKADRLKGVKSNANS
jgi:oligoribonuclease (3'-5' exoribonuclease)